MHGQGRAKSHVAPNTLKPAQKDMRQRRPWSSISSLPQHEMLWSPALGCGAGGTPGGGTPGRGTLDWVLGL